jgi:hypothetical protein
MSDYVFLSTASVVIILVGVALLAMLATLTIGALGRSGRGSTVALFVSLAVIWVGAVFVVMLIKLMM